MRLPLNGSIVQSGKTDSEHFSCEARLKSRLGCERAQLMMASPARVSSGKLWRCPAMDLHSGVPHSGRFRLECVSGGVKSLTLLVLGIVLADNIQNPVSTDSATVVRTTSAQSFEPSLRDAEDPAQKTNSPLLGPSRSDVPAVARH